MRFVSTGLALLLTLGASQKPPGTPISARFENRRDTGAAFYTPVDEGSSVSFKIKNLGFNVTGSFSGIKGRIIFHPQDLAGSSFDVTVEATTINTDNEMRDNHLRSESYFNVKDFPQIRFVSTGLSPGKSGYIIATGKLTIKDKTRDISFPFLAIPMGNDYIFSGGFPLKRKDFEVGGGSTISNDLTVTLKVFARKQ
jgi:polyisoprenoid-binding protein YceI